MTISASEPGLSNHVKEGSANFKEKQKTKQSKKKKGQSIDLFSLYVLFSHFRPRDGTL